MITDQDRNMRVLLVEDDTVIADYVTRGMRQAGFAVAVHYDGISGLDAALNQHHDIAIVDLMLPELDGLSLIQQLRLRGKKLPVIILSAKRSLDDRISGLRQGGDDYLTKPFSFSELLARVEALIRRASDSAPDPWLEVHDLSMDLMGRTVTRAGKKINLQPKEFALLEYLVRNSGRVVSKTMIMERVWNYDFDPGTNVVEARISKLREKIDRGSDTPLLHTVRGLGYVLKVPDV